MQVSNGENKKDVNLDLDREEDQEETDDSGDGKNNPQVSLSSSICMYYCKLFKMLILEGLIL